MITYKLRPDNIPVRIDSEAKTITNVVNKPDQKILGYMSNEVYYTTFTTNAASWPDITEAEFNAAKAEVIAALSTI
jgi:hypothetical protein